jgi:hypothetical protein
VASKLAALGAKVLLERGAGRRRTLPGCPVQGRGLRRRG